MIMINIEKIYLKIYVTDDFFPLKMVNSILKIFNLSILLKKVNVF